MSRIFKLSQYCSFKVWIVSAVLMALFMGVILPYEAGQYAEATNQLAAPDTQLFYTANWLFELASNLGEEGRRFYIISRLRFDVLWPLVFTFFFFTSIALLYKDAKYKKYFLVLPFLGLVFDYLENSSVSIVFFIYPERLTWLAALAGFFTFFKWLAIAVIVGILITGMVRLVTSITRVK